MNDLMLRDNKPNLTQLIMLNSKQLKGLTENAQIIGEIMTRLAEGIDELKKENKELKDRNEVLKHRVDNLDCSNIEGTPRQRLVAMIRKYAMDRGILYNVAWGDFRRRFDLAYRTNIEARLSNYRNKYGAKDLTMPEFLERVGLIEDALRVADKMINSQSRW